VTLVLLLAVALAAASVVSVLTWRWSGPAGPPAEPVEAAAHSAGEALRRHPGTTSALGRRLDPAVATGLALTLAGLAIVVGGVVFGVLAYLVRGTTDVVHLDQSVARWGWEHLSSFSRQGLEAITHLGEPTSVVVMAAALAAVETVRTRSRWVVPFVTVVVAGNGIITTTVKHLADRVRPELNPVAETLGPSFPSGHSSWSAAFFAAAALLLSRGRSRGARAALAGAAAGITIAIAGSRVLLSVHWLSDVIAGLAVGYAWFAVCAIAFGGRLLTFGAPAEAAVREARGTGTGALSRPPG
jgi:membrane-associated phospholipid phosphatase